MAKMINVDELIEFCNTSRSMLHEHYNSVACAALRRVVEFAKEYAVEVEPVKHGRWIFQNRSDEDGRHIYRCSECDFEVRVFPCNFISWEMHEKCCAGCGARMDGDSDD